MEPKDLNEITDQIANGLYDLSNSINKMDHWFELVNLVTEKLQDITDEFDEKAEIHFVNKCMNGNYFGYDEPPIIHLLDVDGLSSDEFQFVTCLECLSPIDECTHAS